MGHRAATDMPPAVSRKRRMRTLQGEEPPPWLITYSDLMTLLLAFFVLLVGMTTVDETRRKLVLDSVINGFGIVPSGSGDYSGDRLVRDVPSGAEHDARRDLGPLQALADAQTDGDVAYHDDGMKQVFAMTAGALFEPGGTTLSVSGRRLLAQLAPVLRESEYPLLVAGHAAPEREELGVAHLGRRSGGGLSPVWALSAQRATSVYRALTEMGVPAGKLHMAGYGDSKPRGDVRTAAGRRDSRRVELILDRQARARLERLQGARGRDADHEVFRYQGFSFDIDIPGGALPPASTGNIPPGASSVGMAHEGPGNGILSGGVASQPEIHAAGVPGAVARPRANTAVEVARPPVGAPGQQGNHAGRGAGPEAARNGGRP